MSYHVKVIIRVYGLIVNRELLISHSKKAKKVVENRVLLVFFFISSHFIKTSSYRNLKKLWYEVAKQYRLCRDP